MSGLLTGLELYCNNCGEVFISRNYQIQTHSMTVCSQKCRDEITNRCVALSSKRPSDRWSVREANKNSTTSRYVENEVEGFTGKRI